jgi:hypothetical protein
VSVEMPNEGIIEYPLNVARAIRRKYERTTQELDEAKEHIEEDHKILKRLFDMHVEDREYPGFCEECSLGWPCRTRRVLTGRSI